MADSVTWEREDHTKAKHELLLAFFNKWVSIHSEHFAGRGGGVVRIYDGFAGPGVYTGGEPGSPLILLRALCTHPRLHERWQSVRYELHFVEKDPDRAAMLEQELKELEAEMRAAQGWSENVQWSVTCGNYEENVPEPVPGLSALFLFIDPFGYSHAPMTLTKDLIQQPRSDTLIFLPLSFVHRFADREGQDDALDRFFGTPDWRQIPNGHDRPGKLLALFQDQLRSAGLEWTLPFRLMPEDRRNAYWIVGASGHPAGFASIKEAFWAVDPVNGQGFAAHRSAPAGQGAFLFDDHSPSGPDTAELLQGLRKEFGGRAFTVEKAIEFTKRSRFLDTHLKKATLAAAERAGELEVQRPEGARQFKEGRGIIMRFPATSEKETNICS